MTDARMRGGGLDGALEAARETLHSICMREGGDAGKIDIVPLVGNAYLARISWKAPSGGPGGRAGRKRRQWRVIELSPPKAAHAAE